MEYLINKMQEITTLSSAGNYGYCYLGSNEKGLDETFEFFGIGPQTPLSERVSQETQFRTLPHVENACHIGVSGWYNFDLCCCYKPDYIVICDNNANQIKFMRDTIIAIKKSASVEEFKTAILDIINVYHEKLVEQYSDAIRDKCALPKDIVSFHLNISEDESYKTFQESDDIVSQINVEFMRKQSWINHYEYMHAMAINDRIIVVCCDITDIDRFNKIKQIIDKNGLAVRSAYISNVVDYVDPVIYASWLDLWNKETVFIYSSRENNLRQELTSKN